MRKGWSQRIERKKRIVCKFLVEGNKCSHALDILNPKAICPLGYRLCCYFCEHRNECDKVCDYVSSYIEGEGNEEGMASEDE